MPYASFTIAICLIIHITNASILQQSLGFSPGRSKLTLDDIVPSLDASSGITKCCPHGTTFDGTTCVLGTATCAGDAILQDGKCISRVPPRCDTGQRVNEDGLCVTQKPPKCPDGLELRGKHCVDTRGPICEGDLIPEGRHCFSKIRPQCNGTDHFKDGSCVSAQGPSCGEGNEYINGYCVSKTPPECVDGTKFDRKIRRCVSTSNGCPTNTRPKNGFCVSEIGPKCEGNEVFNPEIGLCVSRHAPSCDDPTLKVQGNQCVTLEGPKCADGYELSFNPSASTSQCCPGDSSWDGVSCVSKAGEDGCLPGWMPSGDKCKLKPRPAVCDPFSDLRDGKCVSKNQPKCPEGYDRKDNNQCVSKKAPQCPEGTELSNGECLSIVPLSCPQGTHFEDGRCLSDIGPQCSMPKAEYDGKGNCVMDDLPRCRSGVHHGDSCLTEQSPSCPDGLHHFNGQCVSDKTPQCSPPLTASPEGDCISHKQPKCEKGNPINGECYVGCPKCPDDTYYDRGRCIRREHPFCTENGYEWFEPEGKCRKKDKTECSPGYHQQNGQCVSDTPGDCGELEICGDRCCHPDAPKCPEESDTYWDGQDCRSPDPPNCGPGKVFKQEKGTCVTESEPVCDEPGTVLDKALNKCVSIEGPKCPDGQRFNSLTQSCVLVVGDCLEFEFCPVITSLHSL